MSLRWGICSTGRISHDFACALSTLDPSLHKMTAVASRSEEKAKKFAELHQIAKAYGSYEKLAADENVDAVYIGSINKTHLQLCKLFLNYNKNVLCEKPLALNVKETKEILALAKEKDRFLMEAMWSRFFPVYQKTREIISSNQIGEVTMATANFTKPIFHRPVMRESGGGAAYALGMYTVQWALLAFSDVEPSSVTVSGHLLPDGVDACANITLLYPENKMAALVYSGICEMSSDAEIAGTKGRIKIYGPCWCPTQMDVTINGRTENFQFPVPASKIEPNLLNSTGLRYEAEAVRQAIKEGKKEHPYMSHEITEMLASLIENVRNSLGYYVDGDANTKPKTK